MSATTLTAKERSILNDAMKIIDRCTAQGSSWQLCGGRYSENPFSYDLTYFDSNPGAERGQHSYVRGHTLADKLQTVLNIEAEAKAFAEVNRQARIAKMEDELAKLKRAVA